MELAILLTCIIAGIAIGDISYILWTQHRQLNELRDLCELRQNTLDDQREVLKEKIGFQLEVAKVLTETIQAVQQFYHRYQRIKDAPQYEQEVLASELQKQQAINDDLTTALSKLLTKNDQLEAQVSLFRKQEQQLADLISDKVELREQLQKVQARNQELEYAINLESVSMIEGYDARDKLYTAIDDVRRSLTRILNTA